MERVADSMAYKRDQNLSEDDGESIRKNRLTCTQKLEITHVILALLLLSAFWQLMIHSV